MTTKQMLHRIILASEAIDSGDLWEARGLLDVLEDQVRKLVEAEPPPTCKNDGSDRLQLAETRRDLLAACGCGRCTKTLDLIPAASS